MRHTSFALAASIFLTAVGAAVADIDERYVREGADSWGTSVAAKVGIPGFGRSIAVVVGVGNYTNGWSNLEAPRHDATRMRDFLINQANFDIIYTLTDESASRDRIRELMVEELPSLVGSNDRVIFYFSGHGTQRELFGNRVVGHLVLADSSRTGWASMIDMRDVERWWEAIAHARQSLFILDACLSGLGLQGKGDDLQARSIAELGRRGHHLITAGTADQDSFASMSRWGGSLFTTALIDGMSGNADASYSDTPEDGIVSLKELWDYVTKRIRSELPPETMTPQLGGFEYSSNGEFFFLASSGLDTTTNRDGDVSNKGDVSRSSIELEAREATIGSPQEDNQTSDLQSERLSGRTLTLTSEDVREIQGRLLSLGFDPEGIDGRIGEKTRAAIMGWQALNNFPQTGYLDFEQLLAVRQQSSDTYTPRLATVPSPRSTRQNVGVVTTQNVPNGARTIRDGCMYEADGSLVIGFNPSNGC